MSYTSHTDPEQVKEREKVIAHGGRTYHIPSAWPKTWCTHCDAFLGNEPAHSSSTLPDHFYALPRAERKAIVQRMESVESKTFHQNVRNHMLTHGYKECTQCHVIVKNLKTHQKSIACLCTAKQNQMAAVGYMQVGHILELFEELMQDDLQSRLSQVGEINEFDAVNEAFSEEKKALLKSLGVVHAVSDYSKKKNSMDNVVGWVWLPWVPMDTGDALLYLYKRIKKERDRKQLGSYLTELKAFANQDEAGRLATLGGWELAEIAP